MSDISDKVFEIARDLYEDADFRIDRQGNVSSIEFMDYDDYDGYYNDCTEQEFNDAKSLIEKLTQDVKYYDGKLELNDNRTLWNVNLPDGTSFDEEEYSMLYDEAMSGLQDEIGTEVYGLGRMGRHICIDDTLDNLMHYNEYKETQRVWEKWLIQELEKSAIPVKEESLNRGEKITECTHCGNKVVYTEADVIDDGCCKFVDCPNCKGAINLDEDLSPSEEIKLADEINKYLVSNMIYPSDVFAADTRVMVEIKWGDWKHDHLRCDNLMKEKGYAMVEEEVTEEDGSDTYSAIRHYVPIGKSENLDENKKVESVNWKSKVKEMAELDCNGGHLIDRDDFNGCKDELTEAEVKTDLKSKWDTYVSDAYKKSEIKLRSGDSGVTVDDILRDVYYDVIKMKYGDVRNYAKSSTARLRNVAFNIWKSSLNTQKTSNSDGLKQCNWCIWDDNTQDYYKENGDIFKTINKDEADNKATLLNSDNVENKGNFTVKKFESVKSGIFDEEDSKSYVSDIKKIVQDIVQNDAKLSDVKVPDKGQLMNDNSVIVYELPIAFKGDVDGLGNEIANRLKSVLESGKVKDVKCVQTSTKAGKVLTLSIIGADITPKTEAEDLNQVKADIEDALNNTESTEQEIEQVKGSLDVLKTDEESAIEGYEDFKKETDKVVDKELADAVNDQMQEIVDDEKEHIEKLDAVKTSLGESTVEDSINQHRLDFINKWKDYKDFVCNWCGTTFTSSIDENGRMPNCPHCEKDRYKDCDNTQSGYADKDVHFYNPETKETIYTDYDGSILEESLKTESEDLEQLANDIVNWYSNDMGTWFDEIQGQEEEVYNDTLGVLESKDIATIQSIIEDMEEVGGEDTMVLVDKLKSLLPKDTLQEDLTPTIKESLNTGVLPIVNVDMYSIMSSGYLDDLDIPDDGMESLDEIVQDIAPKYIKETVQEILPSVEIYVTGVYHPKQYNYSGDELEFELVANGNEYNELKEKAVADASFEQFLKDNYSSRSGFVSSMPNSLNEFNQAPEWKQLVQVIMFALKDVDLEKVNDAYLEEFLEKVIEEFPHIESDLEESKKIEESKDDTIGEIQEDGTVVKNYYRQGYVYKNFDNFDNKSGPCYISEYQGEDYTDEKGNSKTKNFNDMVEGEDYETYDTIIKQVRDGYKERGMDVSEQTIEDTAELVFDDVDWQTIDSRLQEILDSEEELAELGESKKTEDVTPEAQKVSFYTFRVAEEMYNSEHEDTWDSLDDDAQAEYYNNHYPTIFKLAKQRAESENKKTEDKELLNEDAVKEWWVGDPCYVLSDDIYDNIWGKKYDYKDGLIDCENGLSFDVHGTAFGDGSYLGSNGFWYAVDSGTLAVIPMELVAKEDGIRLGTIHKSTNGEIEYEYGVFHIEFDNEILDIDTDPTDDEEFLFIKEGMTESKALKEKEEDN